ncbi:hypothetical protein ACIQOV_05940 [Kitasatospora sp. NPDC091257]|uniref:hypothetical protein n=1 Tax=Kitasatospora sp. NPDC091257 TaxID=3364084 RepID=UPI00382830A5
MTAGPGNCVIVDTRRLAELLEERGDVEGRRIPAGQASRPTPAATWRCDCPNCWRGTGRVEEAIEVMRAQADAPGGAEDWILDTPCTLCADRGRAQDGLDYLDDLKVRRGEEEWELFRIRLPLMAACDRVDEAVEQARVHSEGDISYSVSSVARMLAGAGRTEEALALLERQSPADRQARTDCLIELGRSWTPWPFFGRTSNSHPCTGTAPGTTSPRSDAAPARGAPWTGRSTSSRSAWLSTLPTWRSATPAA